MAFEFESDPTASQFLFQFKALSSPVFPQPSAVGAGRRHMSHGNVDGLGLECVTRVTG